MWNVLWRTAAVLLLGWFLWRSGSIVAMFLLSAAFAYFVWFGVEFLIGFRWVVLDHWKGFKRGFACLICYAALVGVIWAASAQMAAPVKTGIATLTANWDNYMQVFNSESQDLRGFYMKNVPRTAREFIDSRVQRVVDDLGVPDSRREGQAAPRSPWSWLGFIVELVLVPVLAFYFIYDGRGLKREVLNVMPPAYVRPLIRVFRETNAVMRQYVLSQVILCVVAGIVTYLIFVLTPALAPARPYAVIVGLYAAGTRAIPVVGALIGGIPIVLLAAASAGDVTAGMWVAVAFSLMHLLESKLLYPMVVGQRMKMHPVLVVASLLIGFEFFGILGMFFAPPVAAIARNCWLRARQQRVKGGVELAPTVARAS